jgi:chorismate mutase
MISAQTVPGHPLQDETAKDQRSAQEAMKNLCELMNERLNYIEEVSKSKWNDQSQIEDPAREQKILQDVATKSSELGIPTEWTIHFFRSQIEASKQVEYHLFAEWRHTQQSRFGDALDLTSQVRPHLDGLTAALLSALQVSWPILAAETKPQARIGCEVQTKYPYAFDVAQMPLNDHSATVTRHLQSVGRTKSF